MNLIDTRNDRSKWAGVLIAVVMLVAIVIPVAAITYGEPDNGEHPYVGFMLFFDPTYGENGGWFSCSGSALSNKIFLTAGHCTFNIGTNLEITEGGSGGTDVWVTFQETFDFSGFPSSADYLDPIQRNEARFDWINHNKDFTRGTSYPHPEYADFAGFPNTHDVGVVVLKKRVDTGSYAVLADLSYLDKLASVNKQPKVIFETAGYGIQEIVPFFQAEDARYKATSKLVELNSALTDGYNLHTSNNPSESQGKGGSCFGDSGGPVMMNDTNVVVAVVSFGENPNCKGADYGYRTDIADTQDFVYAFLN